MSNPRWYLPRQIAETLTVDLAKVHAWIKEGSLGAVNVARCTSNQPRWRVSPESLADFLASRQARPRPKPARRRRGSADENEFY
jgi:predicted site-specific integrase-resolvase